jgi:hypothetical protein
MTSIGFEASAPANPAMILDLKLQKYYFKTRYIPYM